MKSPLCPRPRSLLDDLCPVTQYWSNLLIGLFWGGSNGGEENNIVSHSDSLKRKSINIEINTLHCTSTSKGSIQSKLLTNVCSFKNPIGEILTCSSSHLDDNLLQTRVISVQNPGLQNLHFIYQQQLQSSPTTAVCADFM